MSIAQEIVTEGGLSLPQLARLVPGRKGGGIDPSAIWRWATSGSRSKSGEIITLETMQVGGRYVSTKSALARFLDRLNAKPESATSEATETKQTRSAKASARLQQMGA